MIENRKVVDNQWPEEKEIPQGQFDRWGGFVHQEHLLEVALEEVYNEPIARGSFLEKVMEYIEENEEAKEQFLKWYYPAYGEED